MAGRRRLPLASPSVTSPWPADDRPVIGTAARAALDELVSRPDPSIVGLVLSGSAARGIETDLSDVDVYVVRDDGIDRETLRSPAIDEIQTTLTDLEDVEPFGTDGWWFRWSFAYAQVLRDETGGRVTEAVRRQATVDEAEQRAILVDHVRLDGWVNFAYRSLKSARDGRPLEARLDATESVPWLLDVVFTLAGGSVRTTSTCRGSCASTRSPALSGRPRRSCPRSSGCWPATSPRSAVPSRWSTAKSAPGTPPTGRPSAATRSTTGTTSSRCSGRPPEVHLEVVVGRTTGNLRRPGTTTVGSCVGPDDRS